MTPINAVGMTKLVSRQDGVLDRCQVCGRDTHYGARVETIRDSIPPRRITLFACYDCVEVCHLLALGRVPCGVCKGTGQEGALTNPIATYWDAARNGPKGTP